MKKRFDWFDIAIIVFNILVWGYLVCHGSYSMGYRDGQINAIEGKIDYEIHHDSTYIEKE